MEPRTGGLSTPQMHRPTGLKTFLMEEVVSALRTLRGSSQETLAAEHGEDYERVLGAMRRLVAFVHRQVAALQQAGGSDQVGSKDRDSSMLTELASAFSYWRGEHEKEALPVKLWLRWAELGCSLEVLRRCGGGGAKEEFVNVVKTVEPPAGLTDCDKELQTKFCCQLYDAVVRKPLFGAPKEVVNTVAGRLMEVFLRWMAAAMRGYEVAFIANVAAPFHVHVRASFAAVEDSSLLDALLEFAKVKMDASSVAVNAAGVAITALVLSALISTQKTQGVEEYLESVRAAMVDELSRGPYPQIHSPVCIVTVALGLAALQDVQTPGTPAPGNATLLRQFALQRLVNLPLLSPRLTPCDEATIAGYQSHVCQDLQALMHDPSLAVFRDLSIRMTETCIEEMVGFFQNSLKTHLSLVTAMQSVLPAELFRPKLIKQLLDQVEASANSMVADGRFLMNAPEIVAFLKRFYGAVAPILEISSTKYMVRAFLALSRIEFAREVCVSPEMNASMQTVTERLEQALEQSSPPPDVIFSSIFGSLTTQATVANTDIPREVDIIAGCQTLAVGFIAQRKLRVLLFQCSPLIDDALAVVFYGLFNAFEPVDTFAHRFLGVCLSHLGQYTPLFTVFPHYLQATLAAYPANAPRLALTKACGVIFGSLFYSETLTMPDLHAKSDVEKSQRMLMWAIRKCCERCSELLAEDDKVVSEAVSSTNVEAKTKENGAGKQSAPANETDGIYLAGLVFELVKMAPIDVLKASAMEAEQLLARWKNNARVLRDLKRALFERISQNCEAEKRAWLAAWYIELDKQYPIAPSEPTTRDVAQHAQSRL